MSWISSGADHVRIQVLIVPRASRTQIVGVHDERLKIKLTAPPVDGKANKALIGFLAKSLNLTWDQINILSGQTGRRKTVQLYGVTIDEARARLT